MFHLKLTKALSYTGIVAATKNHPDVYTEDKTTADAAVATGYFSVVDDADSNTSEASTKPDGKALEDMTVAELETYATYHDVSLKGISKKSDILAKLREELGKEAEGNVQYGSPTMTDLQR